jgi:UDP-N-acetylmuramoyl-tripeptide--D-alanyl-D-alanine ligase
MTILWTSQEVEAALGVKATQDFRATGISIDTRELRRGDIFIALKGPYQDGAQYGSQAFMQGASAVILPEGSGPYQGSCLYVKDTLEALRDLAKAARARTKAQIIGVTGSFGKTSTKEALRLILGRDGTVTANERSFNNHWGVPFTLASVKPEDTYGIIEMGMNQVGEIALSSSLARPHIALITNIRSMHIENLGSLEAIAAEKCEIFTGMAAGGVAVLNADDTMFDQVLKTADRHNLSIITYGRSQAATLHLQEYTYKDNCLFIKANLAGKVREFTLANLGEHWAWNSLGVLGVAYGLGIDFDRAITALQSYKLPEGRGVQHRISYQGGEILVIDESYNAGPDSMRAALKVLGKMGIKNSGRRIAILGDMRELGDTAIQQHVSLQETLVELKIDLVFTCGKLMKYLYDSLPSSMKGGHAEEVKELIPTVIKEIRAGDVIMSKGSKGQYAQRGRMYGFVEALLKLADTPHSSYKV